MSESCNNISIDNFRWGHPGAPLLPKSLRELWKAEHLPSWVVKELGLKEGATYANLGVQEAGSGAITERMRNFLSMLLRSRALAIETVRCFNCSWPTGLKVADVPWSVRTRNCLENSGLIESEQKMMSMTFGKLFRIKSMGAFSALDFCCTLEALISNFEGTVEEIMGNQESPQKATSVLEAALSYPWIDQISGRDPRFAHMLPFTGETIKQRIESILSEPDLMINVFEVEKYCNAISNIRHFVDSYEKQPLEVALANFLRLISHFGGKRLEALADRFGCSGLEPASLGECGSKIGITRERFRQIESKFLKEMPQHSIFMPELDDALRALEESIPIAVNEARSLLRSKGISSIEFHPSALLETARLFNRESDLIITSIRGTAFVTTETSSAFNKKIARLARSLAGESGVANVFMVLEDLKKVISNDFDVDDEKIINLLRQVEAIRFLDDDWFWVADIPSHRNRLVNVTNKILSVASPQNLTIIREGVKRVYRWRASTHSQYQRLVVPPLFAMRAFLAQQGDFSIEHDTVASRHQLNYREVLGDVDIVLAEVIRTSPTGLLDRSSFAERCRIRGVNEYTFSTFLTYSPIIEHVDIDIWKLRGTVVDPAAVDAMRQANQLRPRGKRVRQYGWSPEGQLWIAARMPKSAVSVVIGCPSAIAKYLIGKKFPCYAKDTMHECGNITINDTGMSYGYGQFIRRHGLDENDVLLVEFDLSRQIATLATIDEHVLDEGYT